MISTITLHKYAVSINIEERYATTTYSFDFENMRQDGSNELKFEITIDPESFISQFTAIINDEVFHGITKEKTKAAEEYEEAKEKNENAILISQPYDDIPNVFQIQTNIDAKSKISLSITIEQYLQKRFDYNQLNIQILRNFQRYAITQAFDSISFDLNISDESGIYDVDVPLSNHDIVIYTNTMDAVNKKCKINGVISHPSSLNELVVKYKIKGESEESHVLYDAESGVFCHILSDLLTNSTISNDEDVTEGHNDANVISNDALIPRRVVFVVDRSGSMRGNKWKKTISSTVTALKQLRKHIDRYCVVLFDEKMKHIPCDDADRCTLANGKNITESVQYLAAAEASGGTNINDALLWAIQLIKTDIQALKDSDDCNQYFMNQIILITDGEPNAGERNTKQIITNVQKANHLEDIDPYTHKISIFSFGIGSDGNDSGWIKDLNHSFLKTLSTNNNGFYKRIKQTTADTLFTEYFDILSKPVLSNIDIEYHSPHIHDVTQNKWHTLYSGNDLIIAGKIESKDLKQLNATVTAISAINVQPNEGNIITKPIHIKKEITIEMDTTINTAHIQRIWAYLKLQQFAKKRLMKTDMIEMDEEEKKNEDAVPLSMAMEYKFVTPWTSMIVVNEKDEEDGSEGDALVLDQSSNAQSSSSQNRNRRSSRMNRRHMRRQMLTNSAVKRSSGQVEHKKRTKSLMLLQNDLFVMSVTTVFRNLEDERIWIIDQSVREHFNAKMLYELALKEDIPWREWNRWIRKKIVEYLRAHNLVKTHQMNPAPQAASKDNHYDNMLKTPQIDATSKGNGNVEMNKGTDQLKHDEECLLM